MRQDSVKLQALHGGTDAVIEPLGVPIEGSLTMASTLVDTSKTLYIVRVANHTAKDVWLKPRTCIGIIREGTVVQSGEQLEFVQGNNLVTVCCRLSADPQTPPQREAVGIVRGQRMQAPPRMEHQRMEALRSVLQE